MQSEAIINVYKGEWGLPSIDFDCLRALCLLKFTGAPLKINTNINPFRSKNGVLPYINRENKKIIGYEEVKKYLAENGYSLSQNLTSSEEFLSSSYETLLFNNFHPYFQYTLFGNPQNVDDTRSLYARRIPFPFNFYYPSKYKNFADNVLQVFGGFSVRDNIEFHETEQILFNAKKCVNLLATKLANKKWFFGDKCTEFDGLVYSYLSIILHITLPNNPLQPHLLECTNLHQFINRITKEYFSKEAYSSKAKTESKNGNSDNSSEYDFFASKRKTQIFAILGAILAMSTYASYMGILKISSDGQYDDAFNYEDDDDIGDN